MVMAIIIVSLLIIALCIAFSRKKFKCYSCRYYSKRNRNELQIDTCKLLGCPACVDECRFYEREGTYK
jgi:hypothetical protein